MKVLLFSEEKNIKPVGGPRGYLYNLKLGLSQLDNSDFYFLNSVEYKKEESEEKVSKGKQIIKNLVIKINLLSYFYKVLSFYKNSISINKNNINYNEYDIIHFHSTFDLYRERNNLKSYNGKVLLTSHSPKPWHKEYIDDNYYNKKCPFILKRKLEKIDKFAFNNADYIIFPCEYAEEPYYNQWTNYKNIKANNKNKYKYLISGTRKSIVNIDAEEIRKKYNIPKNAFIISYVGRHNEVKGYDTLLEVGSELLKKYKDLYFIIAGKEEPLKGLNHKRWIEVGWTNDPHSIISASNLFILPNKQTYFDLIFLEVLSLGVPILASFTGGNKYFKKFNDSAIYFYSSKKEMIDKFKQIKADTNLNKKRNINYEIFKENFDEKKFAENYVQLITELLEEDNEKIS